MTNFMIKRFATLLIIFALAASASISTNANNSDNPNEPSSVQSGMDWRIAGPMGGDIRSLVIDPLNAQRILVGTIDGQIYESRDGGSSWAQMQGLRRPNLYIDHLAIHPRNSNMIFAAAHRHKEPGGFFKSTDGGQTWRDAPELRREALHSMTIAPSNPDMIVVGSNNGIYRSMDAGETWQQLPTQAYAGLINIESLAIDPRSTDTIYAGTWMLPWKTTDGGRTWTRINNGMLDDSDVFAIEVDQNNPNHVIASACSGIYESQNGGMLWRKVNGIPSASRRTRAILQHPTDGRTVFAGTTEGFWRSTSGGDTWMLMTQRQLEINAIGVHPQNPQTVYIGTNNYGVMISRDGGRTFAPSNSGFSGRRAYAITTDHERPNRVYAATINTATGGGFFFISNDGGQTWTPSMRGMNERLITYSILQDAANPNLIYLATNFGVYRSMDRGSSWAAIGAPQVAPTRRRGRATGRRGAGQTASRGTTTGGGQTTAGRRPDDTVRRAQAALNAAGYTVGTPDGVAGTRTVTALRRFQTDRNIPQTGRFDEATLAALGLAGGMTTQASAPSVQSAPVGLTEIVNMIAPTPDERNGRTGLLAATNTGLYRTYDPATGWQRIPYGGAFDARTLCISVVPQNGQTIYVGTARSGVLVTRDGGQTWQQVQGIPPTTPINTIVQDPRRSAYVYVGTTAALYVSQDGGERWMRRGGNLPPGTYTSILINPQNSDEIFVGDAWERGGGVYRSTDAGQTWERLDPQLPSRRVWALALDPRNPNRIFVGSHSAGVYVAERNGSGGAVSTTGN